jgi:transcription antitermination factor NusG
MPNVVESLHRSEGVEVAVPHASPHAPHWYAAYTCANHEKRVGEHFTKRLVEHFLPLYESTRHWKDRRIRLELPLFPGYIFVRLAISDRLQVVQVPGVVNLIGFGGRPSPLPEDQIATLRQGLISQIRVQPHPYLQAGRRVRVRSGPLAGLQGILLRRKNRSRFVISLDLIMRSVAAEIDLSELEPDC